MATSVFDGIEWLPWRIYYFILYIYIILFLLQAVDALVESSARVTEVDNDGRIPMILAAQEGHLPVVSSLLEAGSPIESKAHDGKV